MPSPFAQGFDLVKQYQQLTDPSAQLSSMQGTSADPLAALRQQRSYGGQLSDQLGDMSGGKFGTGAPGAYSPAMLASRDDVTRRFGINGVHGFATSGHSKNSDHYHYRAWDLPSSGAQGQSVANYMVQNAGKYQVKYVIFNNSIWKPGVGWRPYKGNGIGDSGHVRHVHVSYF